MEEGRNCIEENYNSEPNQRSEQVPDSTVTGVSENAEKQLILDEILKIDEVSKVIDDKDLCNEENPFTNLINNLILQKNCDAINAFFQVSQNIELLNENTFDVVPICTKYLTDRNYNNDLQLYACAENLLKLIAQHTSPEEVLFELMEVIETTKSDNALTTALKALQICLQRQSDKRPRSLEWALNSILNVVNDLPKPDYLTKGYDERQERLLEQNEQIYRILTNYITLTLFYEPLYNEFIKLDSDNCTKNQLVRKDILTCFILQLLGRPLALLDLSKTKKTKTNTYSLQCATTFANHLSTIFGDPYYLLRYIQLRSINKSTSDEKVTDDYFMMNEKCPLLCIGIYYYMVICEEVTFENTPKIYNPLYIFESCLYLIIELFNCDEPNIQYKGILLGHKIVKNIDGILLTVNSLQLNVQLKFYTSLTEIIIFSSLEHLRKSGMLLFQNYFNLFDDDGKFSILKKLITTTKHNGLLGYLMVSYKNLIDKQLKNGELSINFCGREFKNMLLNFICKLNNNIETDLMENYDQIISALNIIRYFVIRDHENQTGFWNFLDDIKKLFLEPLRLTIHLTRNNYKAEECRIQSGKLNKNEQLIQFSLLSEEDLPQNFTKEQKLKMISCAFINFDLMESLLARVNECIDNNSRKKCK